VKITPIRNEESHRAYLDRASTLITRTDQDSLDELELLQLVIDRWERSQYEFSAPSPIDAIKFRMAQLGLKPRDLEPYVGSRSRVSEVLSGARPLSIDMIRALHFHLGIPAASLIAAPPTETARKRPSPSNAAIEKLKSLGVLKPGETIAQFVDRYLPPAAQPARLRKTRTDRTNAKTDLPALEVWCAAVIMKADAVNISGSGPGPTEEGGRELARLSVHPDGPARVPETLRAMGVAFVVLDHLPGTYLDGAALCRTDGIPVLAMTLRHDRLDNFWFTLLHEYCHVIRHLRGDRRMILDDLDVKTSDEIEDEADAYARDTLVPPDVWLRYHSPDMGQEEVAAVAAEAGVHTAIVAGRWQRENNDYRRFSKVLGRGQVRCHFAV
jgi:HTH-type transcriptional regulator/antitoxin HigA